MFIKKLHSNRHKLATCVLAVFSVVFVCYFFCDFGIINNAHTHPGNGHFDHEKASGEDCCEEETSQFYASLVKREFPIIDLDKIVVTLDLPWRPTYHTHYTYKETNPYTLNNALSPPIAGLYARILFQSFLC